MLLKHLYRNSTAQVDLVSTIGASDYISNGETHKNSSVMSVMVADEDALPATGYPPCSIAYTAGFEHMWQMDASGEWQTIL